MKGIKYYRKNTEVNSLVSSEYFQVIQLVFNQKKLSFCLQIKCHEKVFNSYNSMFTK